MKVCILGDTHIGARNGAKIFSEYFSRFFTEIFFPYLKKNDISLIVQLGDILDNRKNINIQSVTDGHEYFFDKLKEHNIKMITILGNHDVFFKNTLKVNSPSLLLKSEYIQIIDQPTEMNLNGYDMLFLPWICEENKIESLDAIANSKSDVCFGHLEFSGFAMYRGIIAEDGMDSVGFSNFEYVFTGHYHCKSSRDNIYYLGTPYELTWSDSGDLKGFHVFDFSTRHLQFIENPLKMFNKIIYDDSNEKSMNDIIKNGFSHCSGTYVKLMVKSKDNPYLFDLFFDELSKSEPIEISVIEDMNDIQLQEFQEIDESQDTLSTINKFIDSLKTSDVDCNRLKNVLGSLYHEAMSIQT